MSSNDKLYKIIVTEKELAQLYRALQKSEYRNRKLIEIVTNCESVDSMSIW